MGEIHFDRNIIRGRDAMVFLMIFQLLFLAYTILFYLTSTTHTLIQLPSSFFTLQLVLGNNVLILTHSTVPSNPYQIAPILRSAVAVRFNNNKNRENETINVSKCPGLFGWGRGDGFR